MKKTLLALALLAGSAWWLNAFAGPAMHTVEIEVDGLNCSLCSDAMKTKMKTLVGASDVEPRLECGKIYFTMPEGSRVNEQLLSSTLLTNGFTYRGQQPAARTMAEVRKLPEDAC